MDTSDLVIALICLTMIGVVIAGLWKVYEKAGEPGWTALVPIYNAIVLLRIVGMRVWWILPLLIPYVGIVVSVIVLIKLARAFGKGGGFATGLILLGIVFIPILGFGSARYLGPDGLGAREKTRSRADEDEEERESRQRKARSRRDVDEDEEEEEVERPRKTSLLTAHSPAPSKPAANKPTVVECISCQRRLRVPANVVGKKVKCPQCGNVFLA